ncbi:MAG: hypothetical protein ABS76_06160 [Pelagibacterium sp. SCN 64-44]|nr:MAG: hypothetical protein ABS76_06160 [Pelagibacterium sp. SCN 64-44]
MTTAPDLDWFFGALATAPDGADIRNRLNNNDPVVAALAAYMELEAGRSVPEGPLAIIAQALGQELDGKANRPCPTWLLALWAAVLRIADRRAGTPRHAALLARVKNHAYLNHVRGGTLMADSHKSGLDHTILLAAVPFGLFEPEDLALVAAVNELTARGEALSADERLLLAWYFGEQGSYGKSRALLGAGDHRLAGVVAATLARHGQLADSFIRHSPMGNGNRYEPLYEERFPKLVTETDGVTVFVRAAPLSTERPVELLLGEQAVISGTLEAEGWRFDLPPHPAGSVVRYRFRFADGSAQDATFQYEVLSLRRAGAITGVQAAPDRLKFITAHADIVVTLSAGQPRLVVDPVENGDGLPLSGKWSLGPTDFVVTEGDLTIAIGGATLRLTDLHWLEDSTGGAVSIKARLLTPRCGIFGLGERYNALDQWGQRVDQFVYNQYKNQGLRTYIPMPVFYTDAGFGLWLATDSYSWFDFGRGDAGAIALGIEAAKLDLVLFSGAVADQVTQFIDQTGTPANVPDWALGPWMSSNNWDSQAEVERQLALTAEHGIPATVLVIEAWSDEATFYIFNDATYAPKPGSDAFSYADFSFPEWGRWPDPRRMIDNIHAEGIKLVLWQIPVIKQVTSLDHPQKNRDEAHFLERSYGVRHPDGTPLRLPEGWFKDSLLMDFTHEEGRKWWFDKRRYLLGLGVDGFKTDGGEMVWGQDLVFADGTKGLAQRNRYPGQYIAAYYDFVQANDGITFSRSGYTGAQTYPAHWAGDERSTWDAFKRSILAGLSAGMSGIIFWGWDMAGFSGEVPSAELYIRSAQMAAFCPIMQYHAESKAEFNQDRTPWNIADRSGDPRALALYGFYARLRMALLPYFTAEAAHCVAARTPLMRPMLLDHPDDQGAISLWDQYRLGRDLLVAPVITEGATRRDVHLPEGRWWHLLEERWYDGAGTVTIEAPLDSIPVFVRDGALVPFAFHGEPRLGAPMPSGLIAPDHLVLLLAATGMVTTNIKLHGWQVSLSRTANGTVDIRAEGAGPTLSLIFSDRPEEIVLNGEIVQPETKILNRKKLFGVPLG